MEIKKTFYQLFRYGLTMVVSQVIIIAAMYLAVDILHADKQISYAIVLTGIYVGVYYSYRRFVFKKEHSKRTAFRFIHILIFSWVANTLLFSLLTSTFGIHYAVASVINTVALGGIRFLLNKYYVFR